MPTSIPVANQPFHVLAKPIGPLCNLDCSYCFYLEKENLFPDSKSFRMEDERLATYVREYIAAQPRGIAEVNFAWQGGEPTLMGVDFFRRVVELQEQYARPGMRIANALQTNATLLNDEWGEFLKEHDFLVGVSIDGPAEIHNQHRFDKGGKGSFHNVIAGIETLQKHSVEFNTLTVVNHYNAEEPVLIYDFLKSIGSTYFQFIPIVEHDGVLAAKDVARPQLPIIQERGGTVGERSVRPTQWGAFLCGVFDRWLECKDVGEIFVQHFDMLLGTYMGHPAALCVHSETCGNAVAIEHNGDVFSCDHYVSPEYKLGNIIDVPLAEMMNGDLQKKFGRDKRDTLPGYCRRCEFLKYCHGACPKDRISLTPDGEQGLQYLCAGYKKFYAHTMPIWEKMAGVLRLRLPASEYLNLDQHRARALQQATLAAAQKPPPAPAQKNTPPERPGRNAPCPCGSGRKFKKCCGRK